LIQHSVRAGHGGLGCLKPATSVRAVTERLVSRSTAPAQRHKFLAYGESEFVAQVVQNFNSPLDQERTIFTTANDERIWHAAVLATGSSHRSFCQASKFPRGG
jgi:hypothetical protein